MAKIHGKLLSRKMLVNPRIISRIKPLGLLLVSATSIVTVSEAAAPRPGLERPTRTVMMDLRRLLDCRPYRDHPTTCAGQRNGLENVSVSPSSPEATASEVDTAVHLGGFPASNLRIAETNASRLVAYLVPNGAEAAGMVRAALRRVRVWDCPHYIKARGYVIEIQRATPNVGGIHASLLVRRIEDSKPKRRVRWRISEDCSFCYPDCSTPQAR